MGILYRYCIDLSSNLNTFIFRFGIYNSIIYKHKTYIITLLSTRIISSPSVSLLSPARLTIIIMLFLEYSLESLKDRQCNTQVRTQ